MDIHLTTPSVRQLDGVVATLRSWQADDQALQLHPGDLGWYSMRGVAATAAAIRVWSADDRIVTVGLLDGDDVLRMAFDPQVRDEDELVQRLAADLDDRQHGPLSADAASVEARGAEHLKRILTEERGWQPDELWVPFRRDLSSPVAEPGVRVEVTGPDQAAAWVGVHWSAFRGTPMAEDDLQRRVGFWRTMADGPIYAGARSLAAFDTGGQMVAVSTVWSAGPGRPGLIEPMGVHHDHRRMGYGTAITRAAATALRDLGASSAIVCTEHARTGALVTYAAAGFTADPPVADLRRKS